MEPSNLFNDRSDNYAKTRPRYPKALYEWLSTLCHERISVWDAACGNGQAAADLRHYFQFVEATDISPAQIEAATAYENVHFSVQASENAGFATDQFDAVCVAQALHWFDFKRFWPQVQRVLKPDGVFAAWGYTWPRISQTIDAVLETEFLSVIKPYWAPQNRLLWNGYQTLSLPFKLIETPEIVMVMEWDVDELFGYLSTWSATRRCMDEIGDDFFWQTRDHINRIWASGTVKKVSMDFVLVAGRNKT